RQVSEILRSPCDFFTGARATECTAANTPAIGSPWHVLGIQAKRDFMAVSSDADHIDRGGGEGVEWKAKFNFALCAERLIRRVSTLFLKPAHDAVGLLFENQPEHLVGNRCRLASLGFREQLPLAAFVSGPVLIATLHIDIADRR